MTPLRTSTVPRPRRLGDRASARRLAIAAGVAIAAVAVFVVGSRLFSPPSFVPRVEARNASEYVVDIDVTRPAHDGWMAVGIAEPHATTVFEDVYDHGDRWIFRFALRGGSVERSITRSELERLHWQVDVPSELAVDAR